MLITRGYREREQERDREKRKGEWEREVWEWEVWEWEGGEKECLWEWTKWKKNYFWHCCKKYTEEVYLSLIHISRSRILLLSQKPLLVIHSISEYIQRDFSCLSAHMCTLLDSFENLFSDYFTTRLYSSFALIRSPGSLLPITV